jgi:hypothetical protein
MRPVLLVSALALFAVGCKSDSTAPKVPEAGTYTLLSVNGVNVPAVTADNAVLKTEILSGTLVINADGTFSETRAGRITPAGGAPQNVPSTQAGTWADTNGALVFTTGSVTNPTTLFGSWIPGVIVYTASGSTFKYVLIVQV